MGQICPNVLLHMSQFLSQLGQKLLKNEQIRLKISKHVSFYMFVPTVLATCVK